MDVSEITKVASRKRLNVDAEKLREKVSRETAKIIKLKVAQDTAYWDLKEKLQQVEGNHERLQQNMVEVQMQHEAISGQYQDELRLRPDTLNKLSSTREICDVLEEYSERLKDTLSRCKNDQASLCDAYQKSGRLVRQIKKDYEWEKELQAVKLLNLTDKAAETNEYHEKLINNLTDSKQKAESDLSNVKDSLNSLQGENENLVATITALKHNMEDIKKDNAMKDEIIKNIQEQSKTMMSEQSHEVKVLQKVIKEKDAELNKATETIQELHKQLKNQEIYMTTLRNEIDQLRDQVATYEGIIRAAEDSHSELTNAFTELNLKKEDLMKDMTNMTIHNNELSKTNSEIEKRAAAEKEQLEDQLSILKNENNALNLEVNNTKVQCVTQASEIKELQATCHKLTSDVKKIETAYEDYMRNNEKTLSELKTLVDEKEKDIASKACTIAQLMCEVGTAGETTARLEATLQKIREETELERRAATEREGIHKRQVESIQAQIAEKENELSKQMSIILEMRSEKDRLQEKIQNMQSKIDNIQKELSEPQPRLPVGDAPELDDNAMAFAPTPRTQLRAITKPVMDSSVLKPHKKQKQESGKLDSMLFSLFSDTSMDEDSNMIDRREVDRRFEALARGEPLPPTSINSLKRRKAPSGGLKANNDEDMSLSQIKKNIKSNEPRKFFKNMRPGNKK